MRKTKKTRLSWFTARVLVKLIVDSGKKTFTEYEDRLMLVKAADHRRAKALARKITKAEDTRYKNTDGDWVTWQYARVADTLELFDTELGTGTEVWWRYLECKDPMRTIRKEKLVP